MSVCRRGQAGTSLCHREVVVMASCGHLWSLVSKHPVRASRAERLSRRWLSCSLPQPQAECAARVSRFIRPQRLSGLLSLAMADMAGGIDSPSLPQTWASQGVSSLCLLHSELLRLRLWCVCVGFQKGFCWGHPSVLQYSKRALNLLCAKDDLELQILLLPPLPAQCLSVLGVGPGFHAC